MSQKPQQYENKTEDNFYKWKGVKPPQRTSHGITEEGIDELLENNLAGHVCQWVQRGNVIKCEVGEYEHGKVIPVNQRLTGTDAKGQPILEAIVFG